MPQHTYSEVTVGYITILGYLKDSNAAAHSVDNDIFYAVIHLQLCSCDTSMARCDKGP